MTYRTLYLALFAVFAALSAAPLQAQAAQEPAQAEAAEVGLFDDGPVTVHIRNDNWLDVRVYVVDSPAGPGRWPLGNVVGLTQATFEVPEHLKANLGSIVLVAEPTGSRSAVTTDLLPTYGGAVVEWVIGSSFGLSTASVW